MRSVPRLVCVVLSLSAVAACGGSSTGDSLPPESAASVESTLAPSDSSVVEPAPANGLSVEVQSLDNSFRLQDLTVEAGTEVVFVNVGRNVHNVLPEPDSIGGWGVAEEDFEPGDEYRHVFDVPGVYAYVCTIHGVNGKGMVGTVTVTG
jgi:plastocyanin